MPDLWYPAAVRNPAPPDVLGKLPALRIEKGVLHTTESLDQFRPSASSYFGHDGYPHFTVSRGEVYQHVPMDRCARALRHPKGTPHTNNDGAVQIEVDWRAEQIRELPARSFAALAILMAWLHDEHGLALTSPVVFYPYPPPVRLGSEPWRLTWPAWDALRGWCGHQHVPGNLHGDPGAIDVDALLDLARTHLPTPTPTPTPTDPEDDPMRYKYVTDGETTAYSNGASTVAFASRAEYLEHRRVFDPDAPPPTRIAPELLRRLLAA